MSTQDLASNWPPPPLPNTYWVLPGRLLAGEYPGAASRKETQTRLNQLVRAGVRTFIDLTQVGEIAPYAEWFDAAVQPVIEHLRFGIEDHGIPASRDVMAAILAAIDAALAANRGVYVHCRAGIGRTGTAVGCYLIHQGLTNEQAMVELQRLWRQSARSRIWTTVPETHTQTEFVRRWTCSAATAAGPIADRGQGAWLGLGIGNAVGVLHSRGVPDPLVHLARAGTGPDTAMALCVADSLLAVGDHDSDDQMQHYLQWIRSSAAETVPEPVRKVVASWQFSRKARGGSHDPKNRDPHSLARTLAVALFWRNDPARAIAMAAEVSATTQQSPVVLDTCRLLAALLIDAFSGATKASLLEGVGVASRLAIPQLRSEAASLLGAARYRGAEAPAAAADALAVLAGVLWAFERTSTFSAGIVLAVETSTVPAITGAVYGALAGAHYGAPSLGARACAALPDAATLRAVADRLLLARPQ